MTRKEIEQKKKEKVEILKLEDRRARLEKLKKLAKEVGASTTRTVATTHQSGMVTGTGFSNEITETEIVQNIEVALQTATMIDMCNTASRNFWIAVVAAIAAVVSALVACIAVLTTR